MNKTLTAEEKPKAIIVTETWKEANEINMLLSSAKGDWENSFKGHFARPKEDYEKKWFWVYNGKDFGGISGYNAYEHSLNRYPLYPTYTLKGYLAAMESYASQSRETVVDEDWEEKDARFFADEVFIMIGERFPIPSWVVDFAKKYHEWKTNLLSKVSDRFEEGFKLACDMVNEMYSASSTHPYMLGDCLLAKRNQISKEEIRKNPSKVSVVGIKWVKGFPDNTEENRKKLFFIKAQGVYKLVCTLNYEGEFCEVGAGQLPVRWDANEIEWLDETPISLVGSDQSTTVK
jgi:hypothetical protein